MSKTTYELKGKNILRDGVKVAVVSKSGELDYEPGMEIYRLPVVKFIKKELGGKLEVTASAKEEKPKADKVDERTPYAPAADKDDPVAKAKAEAEYVAQIKSLTYIDEGAPAMIPELGDKTPAFIKWLEAAHPEHFRVRYQNRSLPADLDDAMSKKIVETKIDLDEKRKRGEL